MFGRPKSYGWLDNPYKMQGPHPKPHLLALLSDPTSLTLLSKMSGRGNHGNTYRRLDRSGYRTRSSTGSYSRRYLNVYVPGFLKSETATMYGLLTCIANNEFHKAMMIILVMNEIIPDFLK